MKQNPELEKQLVQDILAGDEQSLLRFYRLYRQPLSGFIRQKISSQEDMEEVLQDVLLGALDGFRDFSFRCSLFTFLCSIAHHKIVDFYRRKKIKHVVFSKIADVEALLATLTGPEEAFNEEMVRVKIKKTFARLAPGYQDILKWKYVYGYSVEEIADKLSTSFKSAESQLFRARKAFVAAYAL